MVSVDYKLVALLVEFLVLEDVMINAPAGFLPIIAYVTNLVLVLRVAGLNRVVTQRVDLHGAHCPASITISCTVLRVGPHSGSTEFLFHNVIQAHIVKFGSGRLLGWSTLLEFIDGHVDEGSLNNLGSLDHLRVKACIVVFIIIVFLFRDQCLPEEVRQGYAVGSTD